MRAALHLHVIIVMADEKGRLGWVSAVPVLERGQRPRLAGARGVAPVSRRRSRSRSPGVSGPPDRRVRPVGGVCGAERRCLDDGGGPPRHAAVVQPLPFPTTRSSSFEAGQGRHSHALRPVLHVIPRRSRSSTGGQPVIRHPALSRIEVPGSVSGPRFSRGQTARPPVSACTTCSTRGSSRPSSGRALKPAGPSSGALCVGAGLRGPAS